MAVAPGPEQVTGLDNPGRRDRWLLVAAVIQAVSTFGMFAIALVGIWNVQPIITYQLERQERQAREEQARAEVPVVPEGGVRAESATATRFVGEISAWWREQTDGYERILELPSTMDVLWLCWSSRWPVSLRTDATGLRGTNALLTI